MVFPFSQSLMYRRKNSLVDRPAYDGDGTKWEGKSGPPLTNTVCTVPFLRDPERYARRPQVGNLVIKKPQAFSLCGSPGSQI
jgi:hypothetical protein